MATITVQNISANPISTDVGLLNPTETKVMTMCPDQAYRAAENLKGLVDAGKVLVTIAQEDNLLDSLEPAAVGTASVADLAVTTAKLAASAVTTAKINALAVDSTKLAAAAVVAGKIAAGGVSAAGQFAAGVVDATALASGSVVNAKLGAAAVTATKVSFFKSTEQTGNGSEQNVAHGLVTTPGLVMVVPTKVATAGDTFVEGTHDTTNVKVTAGVGAKFIVIAIK